MDGLSPMSDLASHLEAIRQLVARASKFESMAIKVFTYDATRARSALADIAPALLAYIEATEQHRPKNGLGCTGCDWDPQGPEYLGKSIAVLHDNHQREAALKAAGWWEQ